MADPINNLKPDDLFLVNRDGTSYQVTYDHVSDAVKGPVGDTGSTGPMGATGPSGASVQLEGTVLTYADLIDPTKIPFTESDDNAGTLTEHTKKGDLWVVEDNSADPEATHRYPYSAYVNDGQTMLNHSGWTWVGPLQGPTGPRGASITDIRGDSIDNSLVGIPDGYKILIDVDNVLDFESDDIRGATGVGIESVTGSDFDYGIDPDPDNPDGSFPKPPGYKLQVDFKDNELASFITGDIRGATGPQGPPNGPAGPRGPGIIDVSQEEIAAQGDIDAGTKLVVDYDDYNGTQKFESTDIRGSTGPQGPSGEINNIDELEQHLVEIINNLFPPPEPGVPGDGPFVHREGQPNALETVQGNKDFMDKISFTKDSSGGADPIILFGGNDYGAGVANTVALTMDKNGNNAGKQIVNFRMMTYGAADRGITFGFAKANQGSPGSINVGLRVANPEFTLHCKGIVGSTSLRAYNVNNPRGAGIDITDRTIECKGAHLDIHTFGKAIKLNPGNGKVVINNMQEGVGNYNIKGYPSGDLVKNTNVRSAVSDIQELELASCMALVKALKPSRYKDNLSGGGGLGFIADDIAEVNSEFAVYNYHDNDMTDGVARAGAIMDKLQEYNQEGVVAALTKVIQNLIERIEVLENS